MYWYDKGGAMCSIVPEYLPTPTYTYTYAPRTVTTQVWPSEGP